MSSISRHASRATGERPPGEKTSDGEVGYVDLAIKFIGARGLPKMDVGGSADPYFIADLNSHISIV